MCCDLYDMCLCSVYYRATVLEYQVSYHPAKPHGFLSAVAMIRGDRIPYPDDSNFRTSYREVNSIDTCVEPVRNAAIHSSRRKNERRPPTRHLSMDDTNATQRIRNQTHKRRGDVITVDRTSTSHNNNTIQNNSCIHFQSWRLK